MGGQHTQIVIDDHGYDGNHMERKDINSIINLTDKGIVERQSFL